ncbi:response regulator [Planctomycetota bacterium]
MKILIIEDNDGARTLFKLALSGHGYECLSASDGRQGFDLLNSGKFDLVITDLKMPGMDGVKLLELAKTAQPDLQFIVVSGYLNDNLREEIKQFGNVYEILTKPLKTLTLIESVNEYFIFNGPIRTALPNRHPQSA